MIKKIKKQSGFTLMEILVASGIFSIIITMLGTVMINLYQAQRKERFKSDLYEESRFLMERIVREARVNTIDYEEYFSRKPIADNGLGSVTYGENPGEYEKRFLRIDGTTVLRNEGFFNTKANKDLSDDAEGESALDTYNQTELYLISADGQTKTIIKRIANGIDDDIDGKIDEDPFGDLNGDGKDDDDNNGVGDGKDDEDGSEYIGIAKMIANDSDGNGIFDQWIPHSDFEDTTLLDSSSCNSNYNHNKTRYWINGKCMKFITITHPLLVVEDLNFYISPLEDPRKAFSEDSEDIQIQPHVTIQFQTKTNRLVENTVKTFVPRISLQTTVSPRIYHNVIFPDS